MGSRGLEAFAPGGFPEGWHRMCIGEAIREVSSPIEMRDDEEYLLASIRRRFGGMFHRERRFGREILTKNLQRVVPGCFIIARMQIVHGACALADEQFRNHVISKSYSSFESTEHCDTRYFSKLAEQPFMTDYFRDASQGVVIEKMTFQKDRWLNFPICLPPLEEQRRIAEIFDTIGESIQATERVIAKLTAVRTGVLSAALEAAVPTSHQSTVQREFEVVTGITLNAGRVPRFNPVRYLRVANVHRGKVDISDLAVLEATEDEVMRKGLVPGDLLVVEGHASPNEIGRCALVPRNADGLLFQNHLFRLRSRSIIPDVAELILNSAEARAYWRRMCATSSGLHTINSSMLRAMPILIPDRDHQLILSKLCNRTDTPVSAEWRRLEKLREIRSGLAADLLTGRVRTVAV